MEDMTLRATRILETADVILAEDTRTSGVLLKHLGVNGRLMSYHKFNEHHVVNMLAARMEAGETMALVSDAGTPGISDPGFLLVRACIERGVDVQCLPGPTAFVPALVVSGLPCERFCFEGFLPQKKGRATQLAALASETRTMVFYESPHRVEKTLRQMAEVFGDGRRAAAVREISKVHEEAVRGSLAELADHFATKAPRGEFVLVVAGAARAKNKKKDEVQD